MLNKKIPKIVFGMKNKELIFIIISKDNVETSMIKKHSNIVAFFLNNPPKTPAKPNPNI